MRTTAFRAVPALVACAAAAAQAGAQEASVTLANRSGFAIYEMYLSPTQESLWGPDQLGGFVLETGTSFTLREIPCGEYDLRLVDEDGDECEVAGQYLCDEEGEWVLSAEQLLACEGFETKEAASATLINESRWDIYHLFVSPAEESRWGPDQLGDYVLASGTSFTLTDVDCGDYDVKLVDEDGDECVIEEVTLCGAEKAVITDRKLLDCEGY